MRKILIIVLIIIAIVAGVLYYQRQNQKQNKTDTIQATFNCPQGKYIKAEFVKDEVKLTLSDGREMDLPRAMSADGGRYANKDESFVFWNKGNTAFIEEKGQTTFTDCATKE